MKHIAFPRIPFSLPLLLSRRLRGLAGLQRDADHDSDAHPLSNLNTLIPRVDPRLLTLHEQEQLHASAERYRATVRTINGVAADAGAAAFLAPFAERSIREGQELIIGIARKQEEERRGSRVTGHYPLDQDPR